MSPLRKYRNQILFGLLFAVTIYIAILLLLDGQGQIETRGVLDLIGAFPLLLVPVLIALQILVIGFRFIEWHYYLGVIGARDKISLVDSLIIFTASFTMVVTPGKAGEILKAVFLKAKTGVPVARGASVVLAERVVDGLAVIFVLTMALVLGGDRLDFGSSNGIDYDALSRTIIYSSALLLAAGLVAVQIQPLAYAVLRLVAVIPLIRRLHDPLREFYESSREVFRLKHVIPMTLVGSGVYLSSSLCFFVVLLGFGLPASFTLLLQAMFITGVVSAIGALSFVPNGAGITEISNAGMLLAMVAPTYPDMTPALAGAASLVQGFFHKWFRVVIGLAVMVIFRKRLFSDDFERALLDYEQSQPQKKMERTQSSAG